LQYLLLEAMREVHAAPGPFNRLGEFPAEQPNDLPLSATAEAFYRSGALFWQRYTSFWISSLLSRTVFFVIPVVAALIPLVGFTLSFYRWLHIRRAGRLRFSSLKGPPALCGSPLAAPVRLIAELRSVRRGRLSAAASGYIGEFILIEHDDRQCARSLCNHPVHSLPSEHRA
jgi:hypothetical protein